MRLTNVSGVTARFGESRNHIELGRIQSERLDYIDSEPVASVVYQRRKHIINLFVAQRLGASHASTRIEAIQGYNVRHWSEAGLDFWAVSDIAPDELDEFGQVMVAALHPAGSS